MAYYFTLNLTNWDVLVSVLVSAKGSCHFFFGSLCLIASCAQILLEKASSFSANTLTFNNSKVLNHVVSAPKQVIGPF